MNKRTSDNVEWNGNMLINVFLMVSSRTIKKYKQNINKFVLDRSFLNHLWIYDMTIIIKVKL